MTSEIKITQSGERVTIVAPHQKGVQTTSQRFKDNAEAGRFMEMLVNDLAWKMEIVSVVVGGRSMA